MCIFEGGMELVNKTAFLLINLVIKIFEFLNRLSSYPLLPP